MISACKYHRVPIEDVNKNNGAPQRKINIYIYKQIMQVKNKNL